MPEESKIDPQNDQQQQQQQEQKQEEEEKKVERAEESNKTIVISIMKQKMMEQDEEDESDAEEEEEQEQEPEDEVIPSLNAAKARGDVDQWIKYLDESDVSHRLRSLCKKGDLDSLERLLKDKSNNPDLDLDSISDEGWSCLHEIITHECQFNAVAKMLIEFGANVNTQDLNGDSPLHSALLYHNLENIGLLVKNGADLGLTNAVGRMPIHVADEIDTLR